MSDPEKQRKQDAEETRRRAESIAADISSSFAQADAPDPRFAGMGEGPMSRPVQAPQFGADFLQQGGTPGQLIDVIRSMQPADRDAFQEAFTKAVNNIIVRGQRIEDQMPILQPALNDRFKVKPPKTPLEAAKEALTPEDATRAARMQLGLEPKAAQPASPIDAAMGQLSPEEIRQAARIKAGVENRPTGSKTPPSDEEQFMADVKTILPQIEKERVGTDASGNQVMLPLTFAERLQKAITKAQELRGMARNAGVVPGPPAPVQGNAAAPAAPAPAIPVNGDTAVSTKVEAVDVDTAAQEMEAAGITDVDTSDPQFMEVYRRWKESQGAIVP